MIDSAEFSDAGGAGPIESRFPTRVHRLAIASDPARVIDLLSPTDPDALLDDPIVEARYKADDYLPYWPIIWPSGLMMAARILSEKTSPPKLPQNAVASPDESAAARAIELGCGLGLAGIAAGINGWHVTFTDYDPEAIDFARHNALRNGIPPGRVRAMQMDWRQPLAEKFPWVIASDVLYERRLHPLVLSAIEALLEKGGTAWVSDPQRTSAENFPLLAVEKGFRVNTLNMEGESFAGGRQAGQLYVLTRM